MRMVVRADLCVRTLPGIRLLSPLDDHSHIMCSHLPSSSSPLTTLLPNSCRSSFNFLTLRLKTHFVPCPQLNMRKSSSFIVSCKKAHSHGSFRIQPDDDFLEATLLISETAKHYRLLKHGYQEEVKQFSGHFVPLSAQVKDFKADVNSIGLGILQRFRNPTIFLKISCEGDFLLPIVVGEFAVQKLIDSLDEDEHEDYSNQLQFVRELVVELGYEVKMVKITKRVLNTYFARIFFGKVGERETFSVDARPSDAINVAKRCEAPIYVNKQIVVMDALKIAYGTGRVSDTKPVYDVLLDSATEGPDILVEELNLVQSMWLAIKEERYNDAAMWRDKLTKLRNTQR